ncbi:hypothetical protein ATCC90586_000768 [Pythium insidiosum]|nr:hypothetical protein ATCC90586_000768 [Pythium insidiosum]
MQVKVTLRLGDVSRTSRSPVPVPNGTFQLPLDAAFDALAAAVNERVENALAALEHPTDREDLLLYVKPNQGATQRELVALSADNFQERVSVSLAQFGRRRRLVSVFEFESFVFAVRRGLSHGPTVRRATAPRIADATVAIDRYIGDQPDLRISEIARTHWAVTHARKPISAAVQVPTTATFRQMQHIDELRAGVLTPVHSSERRTLIVSLNGSNDLSLTVSVRQLREVLGLPEHNLLAEGIFNSFVPPTMPEDDVADAIAIGTAVSVTFGKIYNPAQQTIGTFTIRTRHSAGSTLQESTGVAGPVITKTTLPLATTTIVPGSLMGGMLTSLVVSFANDAFLAVGSKIIVTVPARFRITGSSLGSLTGIPATGTTAVVTSATTIELTLASNTMSPGTGRSFTMANVYNPGSSCDQYIYEYCTTPWEAYSIQIVDSAGNIYQENTAVTGTPILKKPSQAPILIGGAIEVVFPAGRLSGWIVMD